MAFKKRAPQSGGGKPALSVQLSCKVGDKQYEKGPSFGFWPNDEGGPAFRGMLKDEYLTAVLEFLSNAYEAGLPVSLAMFDNSEQNQASKQGGFKKPGGFGTKKPNPFKKAQQQQEDGPDEEGPGF